ncbi:MAG: DUF378 domain-containing protein [Pseudomonadota bacterium]|nr:DUF378 domain-containing protein [Pseudomonadota bacterium]
MSTTTPPYTTPADRNPNTSFTPTVLDWIALLLLIIGGLNWGLVGAFEFDLVARLFGEMSWVSRAIYILVGLAALYSLSLLARFPRRTT